MISVSGPRSVLPEPDPNSKTTVSLSRPHHRRCGTGIWPDRDITARRPDVAACCAVSADRVARPGPHTRGKPRLLDVGRRIHARDRFAPDSPLEGDGFEPSVPHKK